MEWDLLLADHRYEVRARLTPLTRRMLSMTCKAERGNYSPEAAFGTHGNWRYMSAAAACLVELAREGCFPLLRCWNGQCSVLDLHETVLHTAIEHRQWDFVRHVLADNRAHVRGCCLQQALHQGLEDVSVFEVLLRHSRVPPEPSEFRRAYYAPVLATTAIVLNNLALLQDLVKHELVVPGSNSFWIEHDDLALDALRDTTSGLQRIDWLARAPLLEWLQAQFPAEDIMHARVWLALLRDMVEQQWTPAAIEAFARRGGNTLFHAFCVSPVFSTLRDTSVPEELERWALAFGNLPVLAWARTFM